MQDKQISAACVWAYGLWAASFGALGVSWALDSSVLRALSVIVAMMAATGTVRCYFIDQHQRFKTALTVTQMVDSDTVRSLR